MEPQPHNSTPQQGRHPPLSSGVPDIIHLSSSSSSSPYPVQPSNLPVPSLPSSFQNTPPNPYTHVIQCPFSSQSQPIFLPISDCDNSHSHPSTTFHAKMIIIQRSPLSSYLRLHLSIKTPPFPVPRVLQHLPSLLLNVRLHKHNRIRLTVTSLAQYAILASFLLPPLQPLNLLFLFNP